METFLYHFACFDLIYLAHILKNSNHFLTGAHFSQLICHILLLEPFLVFKSPISELKRIWICYNLHTGN